MTGTKLSLTVPNLPSNDEITRFDGTKYRGERGGGGSCFNPKNNGHKQDECLKLSQGDSDIIFVHIFLYCAYLFFKSQQK
jgi:hypothetical protein